MLLVIFITLLVFIRRNKTVLLSWYLGLPELVCVRVSIVEVRESPQLPDSLQAHYRCVGEAGRWNLRWLSRFSTCTPAEKEEDLSDEVLDYTTCIAREGLIGIFTTSVRQRNDRIWLIMLNARNNKTLDEHVINFFRQYPATNREYLQRIDESSMQVVSDE